MFKVLRHLIFTAAFTCVASSAFAQFPYIESFRRSTATGIVFGGAPSAFLTAGGSGLDIPTQTHTGTPIDPENSGYLRLTSNSKNQKGYIYNTAAFPSSNGLSVELEYYIYGGNGADGISFFLFDATADPFVIGGFGGSLGYAQITTTNPVSPGVSKGYLAVGLDEYGNFSNNGEGRQGGFFGVRPGSVTLRGSGDGDALTPNNYRFLTTAQTSALPTDPFSLVGNPTSRQPNSNSPGYRRVFIDLAPDPSGGYRVTVRITTGGSTPQVHTVIDNYYYPDIAPATLRYGIASSTGNQTNFHEIRNVSIDVYDKASLADPIANDDVANSCGNNMVSIDVAANDKSTNTSGVISKTTIDLDPMVAGSQSNYVVTGKGTFSLNANGLVDFVPTSIFAGPVSASYTIKDNYGKTSNAANITVNFSPPPTIPNAGADATADISQAPDSYLLQGNAALSGTGKWTQVSGPSVATFANANSNVTSAGNLIGGVYVFRWTISSGSGCDLSDDVQITLNHRPVAINDSYRTNLNTSIDMHILDNDNDADGNTTINNASISIKTPPAHGTLQIDNVTGIVKYIPTTDYTGTDSYVYTIKDVTGSESNPALVDIFVNVRPSGENDEATTFSGNPVTILVNDNDVDKTGVTVIKGTDPTNGTIVINPDGSILYSPKNGFSGKDTFTYKLTNSTGLESNPITVTVNVRPIGSTDHTGTLSNIAVTIPVKNNDGSTEGTSVVLSTTPPAHGTVGLNTLGVPVYTPSTGYSGLDNFSYRLQTADGLFSDPILVNVVVKPVGSPDSYTTFKNVPLTLPLKNNDLSQIGTNIVLHSNPGKGNVTIDASGKVVYTPISEILGSDTFTYVLKTIDGVESDPITVNITIAPPIPAPDVTVNVPTDQPVIVDITPPAGGSVIINNPPKHGTITFDPVTGKPIYTPNPGYYGPDDFTYIIKDGNGFESAPGKVTLNVLRAAKIGLAKSIVSNTKNADGSFTLAFIFTLVNYGDIAINKLSLTDDLALAFPGRTVTVSRINGSGTLRTNPAYNGTTIKEMLLSTSTLNANFKEQVELELTISASQQSAVYTNTATVLGHSVSDDKPTTDISTSGLSPDPIAIGDVTPADPTKVPLLVAPNLNLPATSGKPLTIDVTIPPGGSVVITKQPAHGTITFDPVTGKPIYTPNPGYSGPDDFTYVVRDGNGNQSQPGTVNLTVTLPVRIGLAKALTSRIKNQDGTYNLKYVFTLKNYGDFAINTISLTDNLALAFPGASVKVVGINTNGDLRANTAYNGLSDANLLLPTSTLEKTSVAQVQLEIVVGLVNGGVFSNFAVAEGVATNDGSTTSDQSTNGFNPDPNVGGNVDPAEPTVVTLTKDDLKIPGGFSPNNDGINDLFVIENAGDQTVGLEIFNRWGNRIYRSKDYKNTWDGRTTEGIYVGSDVPVGTYYYIVTVDGKNKRVGYITINR